MKIFKYVWQLPQNIIGLFVKCFTKARPAGDHYEYDLTVGSVSLGNYIFLCPSHWHDETILKHEQGHQKQSQILGWLYLIIIGIPSIIWAGCLEKIREKHNISYYSFFTESWADYLGGVKK